MPTTGRSRGVAQEVAAWRERRAAEADRPRRSVLSDLAILTIAQRPPHHRQELTASELATSVSAIEVSFLIVDWSGGAVQRFVRMAPGTSDRSEELTHAERLPLFGTPYELALRSQQVELVHEDAGWRMFAPVTSRGDALGVLELVVPKPPSPEVIEHVASAAHALAYVVVVNRQYTDLFELGQRHRRFSLAAEIQRRLLPASFTCETEYFALAGWVEPASEIAGDTFDYSVDRSFLHVSITDAMGHGIDAALLSTLAVASLRNSRRNRLSLADIAQEANETLSQHAKMEHMVTGLLLQIELSTGDLTLVNAGHHPPLLHRQGRIEPVKLRAGLPLGALPDAEYHVQHLSLEPDDRLVLFTDGLTERNAADLDLSGLLLGVAGAHPRDVVRECGRAVVEVTRGHLKDDAILVCIDWHGA